MVCDDIKGEIPAIAVFRAIRVLLSCDSDAVLRDTCLILLSRR